MSQFLCFEPWDEDSGDDSFLAVFDVAAVFAGDADFAVDAVFGVGAKACPDFEAVACAVAGLLLELVALALEKPEASSGGGASSVCPLA